MMGEGWVQLARASISQEPEEQYDTDFTKLSSFDHVVQAFPLATIDRGIDAGKPAEFANGGGEIWKEKANVAEMLSSCAHTYYDLQNDLINPALDEQIIKDIPRTLPRTEVFTIRNDKWSSNHHNLYKVLRAYAALDPEIGYCQGMNFLASLPLFYMRPDQAFWTFAFLMQDPELSFRDYFRSGFPRLRSSLKTLECLVAVRFPDLFQHWKHHKIHITSFATQWFLTGFTYNLTITSVSRVWDLLFTRGHDFMFAVALTILSQFRTQMLNRTGHDLQEYLFTFSKTTDFSNEMLVASVREFQLQRNKILDKCKRQAQQELILQPSIKPTFEISTSPTGASRSRFAFRWGRSSSSSSSSASAPFPIKPDPDLSAAVP